jgi:DHA1 family bicyclomycin/chloramphenicol resistance-like MFS transporter
MTPSPAEKPHPLPAARFLDRKTPPNIATLVALTGLAALSLNIFLPSLPAMADWFGADYRLLQLSVSVYLGVTALIQIAVGPISDRFGRRQVLLWALAVFLVATAGTLLTANVWVFLLCRMIQASIATGLVLGRAVVRDMVPADQAASMIGYVTMGMAVVPMIGPMIGGALDEIFGWQASFVLLLTLGMAVFWLVWADLGETAVGPKMGFSDQIRQYPELLASPRFWGYCLAAAFASGVFFSFLGGAPFVGSEIYGLSPGWLGFYFGAPSVGYMAGNFMAGRFTTRLGIDRMVLIGTLTTTIGMGLLVVLSLAGLVGANLFFGLVVAVGIGNGVALPGANAGMLSVRPNLAGTASGLGGAIMIGGGAALSVMAGWASSHGDTATPLALMMFASSVASVLAILLVIRRARRLAL